MKIAIVNDMPMAVEALRRALAFEPAHEVVWVAGNGAEAVQRCAEFTPDLILMDLIMPVMDGVEATRRIMAENAVRDCHRHGRPPAECASGVRGHGPRRAGCGRHSGTGCRQCAGGGRTVAAQDLEHWLADR